MPITVYYNNNDEHPCTIRPTPLISVNSQILKSAGGEAFGITYQITLNGKIIASEGTPYAFKPNDENILFDFLAGSQQHQLITADLTAPLITRSCTLDPENN